MSVRWSEPGRPGRESFMGKRLVTLMMVLSVVFFRLVQAQDAPATKEAGLVELRAQLEQALARIEALEKRIKSLEANLADARAPGSSRRADQPAAKADDRDAPVMSKDTKLTGTFQNAHGNHAATAVVLNASKDRVVLRITNEYGTRDWDIKVQGGKATLMTT